MIRALKDWFLTKRLKLAAKWIEAEGYTVAQLKHVAGTDYILRDGNQWVAIGRKK